MRDSDKRKFVRVSVVGQVDSDVQLTIQGAVLDLSLGGACLEHREILRPGSVYTVTLRESSGAALRLPIRVIRTNVVRMEKKGDERFLIYRSGMEFVGLTTEQKTVLRRMLRGGGSDGL